MKFVQIASWELYLDALVLSLVLFLGSLIVGLAVVFSVPRLLNRALKPDKVYPLYGFHYAIQQAISRMTNSIFFTWLFCDSIYINLYLRGLGYSLNLREQTGAPFGTVKHDNPCLTSVGKYTMVCDGLSVINADYSSTSFRVSRVAIGAHSFLGNLLAIPSGARTGDNCLIATKAMVPLDGKVREGKGLLGSPCFEIPRSVERDRQFNQLQTSDELRRRMAAKNRYNLRTMGLFLFIRWLQVFTPTLLLLAAINLYHVFGSVTFSAALVLSLVFNTAYFVLAERVVGGFREMPPQVCTIYDPFYWWVERYWKMEGTIEQLLPVYYGTPFLNVIWRLLGARIGRRVFNDGCLLTERTLGTIGDDCTLNARGNLQCHSMEDGVFKCDRVTLGAGCTVGVGGFVQYGVTMGDGAVLATDSLLMKGEEVPAHARWGGNPATELVGSQASRVTQLVPAQPLAHHALSQGREGQLDHRDERAQLAGQPTAAALDAGPTTETTDTERNLAEVLAGVVRVEQVPVDSHFFEDLGANSLVMAQFCARVRKRGDLPAVSMKDVYQHPTIRSLATALSDAAPTPVASSVPASTEVATPASVQVGQDSNDNWRACRPVQRPGGAPWQTQSGGRKTR